MAIPRQKGISALNVSTKESKKNQRIKSRQSLKKIADAFNYYSEPASINMENDPLGKW